MWPWLPAAAVLLLAGCSSPPGPAAFIRYRQIGACDVKPANNKAVTQAFVLFQIIGINYESSTKFTFDPTLLFVTAGPTQDTLSTTAPILAQLPNALPVPYIKAVPFGQTDFPPASFGVVTVPYPAIDANHRYFLDYTAGPNDPPVVGEKLDLARTVYPYTPDCADLTAVVNQGQYAYVYENDGDDSPDIRTFRIDPATGALTAVGNYVIDSGTIGNFAFDPQGKFLFAMDDFDSQITHYKIQADGSLLPLGNLTTDTQHIPISAVIDPAGRFLFLMSGWGIDAFTLDQNSGSLTAVNAGGHIDGNGQSQAIVDGSGRFLYALSAPSTGHTLAVYTVNSSPGSSYGGLSKLVNLLLDQSNDVLTMTVNPNSGYIYVADAQTGAVRGFQFDLTNTILTELASSPEPAKLFDFTFVPGSDFVYILNNDSTMSRSTVSGTGSIAPSTPLTMVGNQVAGLYAEPTGRFLYTGNGDRYMLNSSNGGLTKLPGPTLNPGPLAIPGTY
jgi:6-phosphogluconolactonase (cycloisomerase 2 family)